MSLAPTTQSLLTRKPTKKLDRRQRRTRKLLSEALLDLIEEKGFAHLSIQEITDRADLNRATFYLHYGSKEELLFDTLETRFDKLVEELEKETERPLWQSDMADLLVFEHVAEHAPFYKLLLNDQGAGYISHLIINYIAKIGMEEAARYLPEQSEIEHELLAYHYGGSLYALIYWWLNNDMPLTPEEMARWSYRLCIFGAGSSLMPNGEIPTPINVSPPTAM